MFIAILLACKLLSLAEWTRLRWILAGYCLSWLFIYFVGTSAAEYYQDNPWRLGLGWAFTLAICLGLGLLPRLYLVRSEEHTSELQSLMRISYAVFFLKKKKTSI